MWNWLKISYRTNKDKNFKYSVFGLVIDLNSEKLQIIWKADCFYSRCPGKSTFFASVQDKEIMHKDEVIFEERGWVQKPEILRYLNQTCPRSWSGSELFDPDISEFDQ